MAFEKEGDIVPHLLIFFQSVEHPWSSCNGHGSQVASQIVRPMSIASILSYIDHKSMHTGQTSIVYRLMFEYTSIDYRPIWISQGLDLRF